MTTAALTRIFHALNNETVRYLVVGGLAVVAHGYVRVTKDLDLVVEMSPDNLNRAIRVLEGLGYRPQAPVPLSDLAIAARRREWVEDKNAKVLTLYSDRFPGLTIDLLLEVRFDFREASRQRHLAQPEPGVNVPFLGLDDLIAMKEDAGRPQDLLDVHKLRLLRDNLDREA